MMKIADSINEHPQENFINDKDLRDRVAYKKHVTVLKINKKRYAL